MTDPATHWLIAQIATTTAENAIWFSDENILIHLSAVGGSNDKLQLITNRWDVSQQAQTRGLNTQFSDFDCSKIEDHSQDAVFYRVSKEKPVVHHLINQSLRILKPGGEMIICGQKNEGIKTYIEKAGRLFGSELAAVKDGANYYGRLKKNTNLQRELLLDDSNYHQLRVIAERNELCPTILYSKPGLFGWNKIDQGSALLVATLRKILPSLVRAPERLLDLGCGYGYLSVMTADLPLIQRVLTDNNAAALIAAKHNCNVNSISADITGDDAGSSLQAGFDLILCNPPFHQGFSIDGDLTDKFLANTKRLLTSQGNALFVVNQFIPLERKAQSLFKKVKVVVQQQGFKVVHLQL